MYYSQLIAANVETLKRIFVDVLSSVAALTRGVSGKLFSANSVR